MIVEITSGKIEGLQKGRLCVFKGRKDIEIDFIDSYNGFINPRKYVN